MNIKRLPAEVTGVLNYLDLRKKNPKNKQFYDNKYIIKLTSRRENLQHKLSTGK